MNVEHLLRRVLLAVPVLFGISVVSFLMVRVIPGDPARIMAGPDATYAQVLLLRREMGLDLPWPQQYGLYLWGILHGNLGQSTRVQAPVTSILGSRFLFTLELTVVAFCLAVAIGVGTGILAASRPGGILDQFIMVLSLMGISMPGFWLGLLLISLFAVQLGILPTSGAIGPTAVVLPAVTLALGEAGSISRVTRASMIETMRQDFVRAARAKGAGASRILFRHVLPNALTSILTVSGLHFGFLLGGAVVVETIFAWPGLGQLLIESITYRDYPVIQGAILVFALEFVIVNLLVDVLYAVFDPRMRHAGGS